MLKEARTVCDYLIVGLQTDPSVDRPEKNKPVQSIVERYVQVQGCRYVDEIIPYESEEDLLRLMQLTQFDVRIIGEEYREKDFTGKSYALDNCLEVYYNGRHHNISSTNLRNKMEIKND
jgi:glycerol-3-phosphate cytidylyltransferase